MKNKIHTSSRFHDVIQTKHVFIKNEQVFLKKDTNIARWFPTDFKWIPV